MAAAPNTGPLTIEPVYSSSGSHEYTGSSGDYLDVGHKSKLELPSGTISLSFSLDRLPGDMALISKDASGLGQGGQFTVWLKDGAILVAFESATGTEYLQVPDLVLSANTTYQFAISFGAAGLNLWLNGELVASEPEFTQGLALNDQALVIGGTRAWHSDDSDPAHSLLKGTVGDVLVFDKQLGGSDMIKLAEAIDPSLAMTAKMTAQMEDLAPVLQQVHHGSDTLKDILADYGVDEHGHMSGKLKMMLRGNGEQTVTGSDGADGINGGRGNDGIKAGDGDDVAQGGYGNDKLWGGNGDDILDGGHGEDRLWGGNGDDLLISRADAREPLITYDADRDEMDPLNELTKGKLYPNQPIPGDDVLTGGSGADIFYFQTLINAKKRYIQKHTSDDGVINWHGVAGENDKLHDHWVDFLGHDVVMDYNRDAGDRIVIEGHTTEIGSIRYGDANGDGVMDHSVISLYSDQGSNGGAHNDDRLGTITVYGDLVKLSDIEHTAKPAYGIVKDIDDLKEALKPTDVSTDTGKPKAPKALPTPADLGLPGNLKPVMAVAGDNSFTPDERAPLVFDHTKAQDLTSGTFAMAFVMDKLGGYQTLFSKDASDYGEGGHITAYINPLGHLIVRLQDKTDSHYLEVKHAIKAGGEYDLALSFGDNGVEMYLNGARVAYDVDLKIDLSDNIEALIVGASGWNNMTGMTNNINSHFNGTISEFMLFDTQLTGDDIHGTDARADYAYYNRAADSYTFTKGAKGAVVVSKGSQETTLAKDIEFVKFSDLTARVDDFQFGSNRDDNMYGIDGVDVLVGRGGDDTLRGYDNDDLLRGGNGNDTLSGGDGQDRMFGGAGDDRLYGGDSADLIKGGDDNDDLYGESGNDRFYGGLGDDDIYGHVWNDSGTANKDRAFFDGKFADFKFETKTWYDSNRGENVTQLIVTDSASGGSDGFYEGQDRLVDIDMLVFADQSVSFDLLT
jgi:Ca2+-binding RTX toxin-like protein